MNRKTKPIISITMGDPAGIGAEITVKALCREEIYKIAKPLVIGSKSVIKDALSFIPSSLNLNINTIQHVKKIKGKFGTIDLLDLNNIGLDDFKYGVVSAHAGRASIEYVFKAIDLAEKGEVDAVVTGPINKESINKAGFYYTGHTEIFAEKTHTKEYAMMLVSNEMRVVHVSTHVSLLEALNMVKKERVLNVIRLANGAMKKLGVSEPKIGVAGLNPHAGEHGLFGNEEIDEIIPAIREAIKEGINVEGPISPDTLFSKVIGNQYDVAIVMYHDQGHIPIKVIGFNYDKITNTWSSVAGVNITLGLPIIRTSVDHGTAYGKAGEGRANEGSLVDAIKIAVQFTNK
ncbi:MAG: 4-hydroxythreonine-4-phosphate dehydrogenase PdxA [Candidatus Altiarchaeales archaeon WOR_SM1_79]|nr:MAG: 4-hydroxythreonine-4-phosphate dehydrogenase PdxA [Candidatus Altiarchaeales archaeon WOR_SM1_79]